MRQRHHLPKGLVRRARAILLPVLERRRQPARGTFRYFSQRAPPGRNPKSDLAGIVRPWDEYRLLPGLLWVSIGCCRHRDGADGRYPLGRWILAGILLPLLLMPIFGEYPLVEHFYILWPIAYYSTAGTVLVTALFWQIDGRSWRRSALLTASIILILIHLSLIQILFMTILAPGMLAMGAGALMASKNRVELRAKIICAFFVVVALMSAGIFHYLYAIGIDTARRGVLPGTHRLHEFQPSGLESHPR